MERILLRAALAMFLAAAGCTPGEPSGAATPVSGRWERLDQPSEWLEFGPDDSFRARSMTGGEYEGRYRQDGNTVVVTAVPEGHGATLTLYDTLLVMEEGTRYRRVLR